MRLRSVLVLGCLVPTAGCHLGMNVARNAYNEPREILDEASIERRLHKEGRAAFAEVKRQYPRRSFCEDFEYGFVSGYADYLDNGGKAVMPAVPPLKYRNASYLNPEGHAKIKDYFLGFKYGMEVAIATGCRPFYTFPILVSEPNELPPLDITVLPVPPDTNAPMPKLGAPLPLPKETKAKDSPNAAKTTGQPQAAPATGLGNPGLPLPADQNRVPVPGGTIPKPIPSEKPTGPGGRSASNSAAISSDILTVSASEIVPEREPIPATDMRGPLIELPAPRSPILDLPPARPIKP
ncbi:MAG: hypothetical protein U0798_02365 [Gemmataceae bacterium]